MRVIGVADDGETAIKARRVRELADETLALLGLDLAIDAGAVEVIASNDADYGYADAAVKEAIALLARTEGIIADPVYEGRAVRGLMDLIAEGRFAESDRVLLMHLGGATAIHAYAEQFPPVKFKPTDFA